MAEEMELPEAAVAAADAGARGGFFRKTKKMLSSSFCLSPRWKRLEFQWPSYAVRFSIVDDFLFKIVSAFELVALLALLSFYFICCGCSL